MTFTPTDTTDYNSATVNVSVTVNPQTPRVATVPTTTAITYGQTLASSTLGTGSVTNAAGGTVSGTFVFTTPGITPNAGSTNVSVTFMPTDTVDYAQATATVGVAVNQSGPAFTVSSSENPSGYGEV